jgi:hypothetical protein
MNTPLSSAQRLTVSRREILRTITATGAGALLSSARGTAQSNARRIDVHHHFQPPVDGMALTIRRNPWNRRWAICPKTICRRTYNSP